MGVLPNFRSVSAGANVPKETTREKLITATEDNYDYTSLLFAGVIAADSFEPSRRRSFIRERLALPDTTGTLWLTSRSKTILSS